jgi:hypothetical protein
MPLARPPSDNPSTPSLIRWLGGRGRSYVRGSPITTPDLASSHSACNVQAGTLRGDRDVRFGPSTTTPGRAGWAAGGGARADAH